MRILQFARFMVAGKDERFAHIQRLDRIAHKREHDRADLPRALAAHTFVETDHADIIPQRAQNFNDYATDFALFVREPPRGATSAEQSDQRAERRTDDRRRIRPQNTASVRGDTYVRTPRTIFCARRPFSRNKRSYPKKWRRRPVLGIPPCRAGVRPRHWTKSHTRR